VGSLRRALAACLLPAAAGAQEFDFKPRLQSGWRADLLSGPPAGIELGASANLPVGYYLRLDLALAGGVARRDERAVSEGRVDLAARYLLDPFREFRWGAYAGGGLTSRWVDRAGWRADLLVLVGLEGPESHGWRTAVEVGAGGGVRLGLVLRHVRQNGR
jgi:hypothetical protein